MINISVSYETCDNGTFDFDYYMKKHIPMVNALIKDGCKGIVVQRPIAGDINQDSPIICLTIIKFENMGDVERYFLSSISDIKNDIGNFTNVIPQVSFNDVIF